MNIQPFKNTDEAVRFGRANKGNAEVTNLLLQAMADTDKVLEGLQADADLDKALFQAARRQFYREAMEETLAVPS